MQTQTIHEPVANILSKRGYPSFIKKHQVFEKLPRVDKIFPLIGLPNFREPVEITNTDEAKQYATTLGNKIAAELTARARDLQNQLNARLFITDQKRGMLCSKIQNIINLCTAVAFSMQNYGYDYIQTVDGRLALKLRSDIYGNEIPFKKDNLVFVNPAFKQGENILGIFAKLKEWAAEFSVNFNRVEQFQEFKDFSRTNVGGRQYHAVFSSTGEDGLWDIATISMRGISSCQSWNSTQSKGLVGSISSKYVAVMYLESDQEIPGYGRKMLNRCVVRFCVNNKTKRPMLIIDKMYPSDNKSVIDTFKRLLAKKSGLEVVYVPERSSDMSSCYMPTEFSHQFLKEQERSYMDFKLNYLQHPKVIKASITENLTELTNQFKAKVCADLTQLIQNYRDLYTVAYAEFEKARTEYSLAKSRWEEDNRILPENERTAFTMQEPHMDAKLRAFFRGGVENFFKHCDKRYGKHSGGTQIATIIMNSIVVPNAETCLSKEDYHRKFLITFIRDQKKIKEASLLELHKGSWMKHLPKSAEKFYAFVFAQMKDYVRAGIKDLIRQN